MTDALLMMGLVTLFVGIVTVLDLIARRKERSKRGRAA
jgi:hypothetical protein